MRAMRHGPTSLWLTIPGLALLLLLFAPRPAAAQGTCGHSCPEDVDPPTITISPSGGTFSSSARSVTINWCDDHALGPSHTITFNGTSVTSAFTYVGSTAACGDHATSTGTVTLRSGTNTLVASISDAVGHNRTTSATYTYSVPDNTPPTVSISPASGGSYTSASRAVTVTWGDNQQLNDSSRSLTLNGSAVTGSFSYSGSATSATASGTITLATGANTFTAHICDVAGHCTSKNATYTFSPIPPTVSIIEGARSGSTQHLTIDWSDNVGLNAASRHITFNGATVTGFFSYRPDPDDPTGHHWQSEGAMTLQAGTNTLIAHICDVEGACRDASWSYLADFAPPSVAFSPGGGLSVSTSVALTITWCDNGSLSAGSQNITSSGGTHQQDDVTNNFTYSSAGSGCATSSGSLTLLADTTTLTAHICDVAGNCANRNTVFYRDLIAPVVSISPTSNGDHTSASVGVTISWSENGALDLATRQVTLNGATVTSSFPYSGSSTSGTSAHTIALAGGTNTLTAHICDGAGNCTSQSASYIYAPPVTVALAPAAGSATVEANGDRTQHFTLTSSGGPGAGASYTLHATCTPVGSPCSVAPGTVTTAASGGTAGADVTYHAGSDNSTEHVALVATYTLNSAITAAGAVDATGVAPCSTAEAAIIPCASGRVATVLTNGAPVPVAMTVGNGTGFAATYTFTCHASTPLVACAAPGMLRLNPGDSLPATGTVTLGAGDGVGTVRLVATLSSGEQVAGTAEVEVLSPTSVVVTTDTATVRLDAGDTLSHAFTVHNAGHLSETFRLDPLCTGVATECTPSASQVTLAAGASTGVAVQYVASAVGGAGTVGLRATHIRSDAVTSTATTAVAEDRAPVVADLDEYSLDYRTTALCVASCFHATASYTTPAYTSLDVARAVTLVYSSAQAAPRPVVRVDITDPSAIPADRFSVQLLGANSHAQAFANGSTEMFFENEHRAERLAVQFDTTALLATGAYPYTLLVTSYWDTTASQQAAIPIRVMVDNRQASPYGAGWSIAGLEHLTFTGDSLLITDGTGSAMFFRRNGCSSGCTYLSPAGDFTTLTSRATTGGDNVKYDRRTPDGTVVHFTTDGREASVEDRFGNTTTYGYDTGNRLITITDPVGQTITLHYTTAGMLDYIEDPMGRQSTFTIAGGNLTQITDPAGGAALTAAYDAQHRLIQLTDRAGHVANLGYDFAGTLAADTLPTITVAGQPVRPVVQYASPATTELVNPTSGLGSVTSPAPGVLFADVLGTVTDPRGNATRYWLTRFGSPWQITEPLDRVTNFSHTDASQIRAITTPSGHQTLYTWSGPDLIQTTDQNTGQTIHITYEPVYHQVATVSGDATPVTNYWSSGTLDSTLVGGAMRRFTSDSGGRVLTSTDPLGHVVSVAYAPSGLRNRTSVTAAGRTTTVSHDLYGRVATVTAPDSGVGTTQYDVLNRVERTIGPLSDTTGFTYGDSLHLTAVHDATGQVYQSAFNALGWVTTTTDPAGHSTSVGYDLAGNAVTTTDRAGQTVTATYDALNQVASVIADGQATTVHTDPSGRFQVVSNAASTDTVRFDAVGRPDSAITWRGTHRYVQTSTYNALGQRTQLAVTVPWSATIGYHYDPVTHQLDTLTDVAGGKTVLGYNADRLADTVRLPTTAGLTISTIYPSTHTPSAVSYSDAALNSVLGVSYSYSPDAQLAQRIPHAQPGDGSQVGREFHYDPLQRLTGTDDYTLLPSGWQDVCGGSQVIDADGNPCLVPVPGGKTTTNAHAFAYDSVGNRTDSSAVIEAGNRLVRYGADTLVYDLDGNLLERQRLTGGFAQTYSWNSLGQLAQVVTNGDTVRFTYDGFGRRVSKTSSSDTVGYLYDGANLLAELDGAGSRIAVYTYYPGIDQPHSVRRWAGGTPSMYYYATELPNNVVGLISSSNTLVNHYGYRPFGTLEDSSETVPNTLRFGAREFDRETGLYYNRARYYDPTLGRFLSEDPIGLAGGINLYAYAGNDPVNATDPSGLCIDPDGYIDADGIAHSKCPDRGMTIWGHDDGSDPLSGLRIEPPRMIGGGGEPAGGAGGAYGGGGGGGSSARQPDYVAINVNVAIPTPWTGTLIGWSGTISLDRYGDWFYSPLGAGVGKSASLVSASIAVNWMDQETVPSRTLLQNMLSANGFNFTAGALGGISRSWTPGVGTATGVGFVSPQAGFSYNYSFYGGNIGWGW